MTRNKADSIEELCKMHRTRTYFDDGAGLVGVYNHRGTMLWYRWTLGGYSLAGETNTPEGATRRTMDEGNAERTARRMVAGFRTPYSDDPGRPDNC